MILFQFLLDAIDEILYLGYGGTFWQQLFFICN